MLRRICRRNSHLLYLLLVFSAVMPFALWTAFQRRDEAEVSVAAKNTQQRDILKQYVLQTKKFSMDAKISNWKNSKFRGENVVKGAPQHPLIVWWAPVSGMTDHGVACDDVKCDVSVKRGMKNNMNVRAFLFYGTEFEFSPLPLPRLPHHIWALEHDESPKNNEFIFSHEEVMSLFNFTSTFKRESSYPISTMALPSLEWLQSKEFFLASGEKNNLQTTKGLAPVIFVHSDCHVPSGRDTYLKLLQKFIQVDVYGRCGSNKDLPSELQGMEKYQDKAFFSFIAQYKFAFAFENAVCEDYMTEKLWRPLHLGVVPIVFGSPKVKEFLPSDKSALVVEDFGSVEELAEKIKLLDDNDFMYDEYTGFKTDGITNKNLLRVVNDRDWSLSGRDRSKKFYNHFAGFECFICRNIHENMRRENENNSPVISVASKDHYGCPRPKSFNELGKYVLDNKGYDDVYTHSHHMALAFRHFYDSRNVTYTNKDVEKLAGLYYRKDKKRPS